MLDELKRASAGINLIIPYFGYARQDRFAKGECFSVKVICDILKSFKLEKIFIIDIHSNRIKKYLKFENVLPLELFENIIKNYDVVVAPDFGAIERCEKIHQDIGISTVEIEKVRPSHEKVKVVNVKGDYKRKRAIIFDDIISTGRTLIAASNEIKSAKEIAAVVTHGTFSEETAKRLSKSRIKKIYVTNTVMQKKLPNKFKVIDISPVIRRLIK